MALTGTFVADFASFYDAVQKAEVSLRSFESGAGKVENSLNRMVDSFSGRKVMQDATLMVEAVDRVGGVTKLTDAEFARLQYTVTAATEKMKALGIDVPPEIQKIANEVRNLEKPIDAAGVSFGTLGKAVMASLASTEIRRFASDVQRFADQFVGAFAEEEAAVKKLTVALQAQGTGAAIVQYKALAAEFQRTTAFSDDLVMSMTALMVQVGGVMPEQMEGALVAAMNLSAGLGIELEAATLLVAKAFGQGGEQLGKLKALLGDTVPKGADMAAVMEAINAKFGGQAAAQMETYSGRMAQLTNQISDFKERVGGLLVDALTPLMNIFASMPSFLQTAIVGIVAIGAAVAPLALSFMAVSAVIGPLVPLIGVALVAALSALAPFLVPAGVIIAGIMAVYFAFKSWDTIVEIAKEVYNGVKTWLVDKFAAIAEGIRHPIDTITGLFRSMYDTIVGHSIVPDMINGIGAQMARLPTVMVAPAVAATQQTAAAFRAMAATAVSSVSAIVSAAGGSNEVTAQNFAETLKNYVTGVSGGVGGLKIEHGLEYEAATAYALAKQGYSFQEILDQILKGLPVSSTPIGPRIPGFLTGGPVLSDGLIYAHAGEYVLPKGNGGITVHNTFYVNGTIKELARPLMDEITRSMRMSRQLPAV